MTQPDADADADADVDADTDADADTDTDTAGSEDRDRDGDGYSVADGDCDDDDPDRHPDAEEVCDEVDQDCDDLVDEDAREATPWHRDDDEDGYGDPSRFERACAAPTGFVADATDCDDSRPEINPGQPELPCDGLDNDCDPTTLPAGEVRLDGVVVPSLAEAVAAALPGSEIALCEGDYLAANLQVAVADLRVVGPGRGQAVLDARGAGPIWVQRADGLTLEGMTLRGGSGLRRGGEVLGGALVVDVPGTANLLGVEVTGNTGGFGGGLYVAPGGRLVLTDSVVQDNEASLAPILSQGGGVFAGEGATLELNNSEVSFNRGEVGGGLYLEDRVVVVATGESQVADNEATSLDGGGVAGGQVEVRGLAVRRNRTGNAGGGFSVTGLILVDAVVEDNVAGLTGAGLRLSDDSRLERVAVLGNEAGIDGAGIDLAFGHLDLQDCQVQGNLATFFAANAGGLTLFDASLSAVGLDLGLVGAENLPGDVALELAGRSYDYAGLVDLECEDSPGGGCR